MGQSLRVYPNPSRGNFVVEFEIEGSKDAGIRVYSVLGQEVYYIQKSNITGKYTQEISLENQSNGMYFVEISVNNKTSIKKVVIRN